MQEVNYGAICQQRDKNLAEGGDNTEKKRNFAPRFSDHARYATGQRTIR